MDSFGITFGYSDRPIAVVHCIGHSLRRFHEVCYSGCTVSLERDYRDGSLGLVRLFYRTNQQMEYRLRGLYIGTQAPGQAVTQKTADLVKDILAKVYRKIAFRTEMTARTRAEIRGYWGGELGNSFVAVIDRY